MLAMKCSVCLSYSVIFYIAYPHNMAMCSFCYNRYLYYINYITIYRSVASNDMDETKEVEKTEETNTPKKIEKTSTLKKMNEVKEVNNVDDDWVDLATVD